MENYEPETETKLKLQQAALEHEKRAFGKSLKILAGCDLAKTVPQLIPYILELQVRNYMAVMQYKKAEKILNDALKYLPNLRNFLLQRIECLLALNKINDAKKEIGSLREKVLASKEDT